MMKKTYISPTMLTVQLGTMHILAESVLISNNSDDAIGDSNEILTKENRDVNVWDEEW